MIILIIIGVLLAATATWIVFIPVFLVIDTERKCYTLSQLGTLRLAYRPTEMPHWETRLFGLKINLSQTGAYKKTLPKKTKKRKFNKSRQAWVFFILRVLKSFKVRKLEANVDSDDFVMNAKLIPALWLLSTGPVRLATNFEGKQMLNLEIEGRLNKVLWAFILFLTKK